MSNNTPDYINNLIFVPLNENSIVSIEDGPQEEDVIEQLKDRIKELEEENERLRKLIETQND